MITINGNFIHIKYAYNMRTNIKLEILFIHELMNHQHILDETIELYKE